MKALALVFDSLFILSAVGVGFVMGVASKLVLKPEISAPDNAKTIPFIVPVK